MGQQDNTAELNARIQELKAELYDVQKSAQNQIADMSNSLNVLVRAIGFEGELTLDNLEKEIQRLKKLDKPAKGKSK